MHFLDKLTVENGTTNPKAINTFKARKDEICNLLDSHISYLYSETTSDKNSLSTEATVTIFKDNKIYLAIKLSDRLMKLGEGSKLSLPFTGTPDEIKDKRIEMIEELKKLVEAEDPRIIDSIEKFIKEYASCIEKESYNNRRQSFR